jgi:agmatinase
MGLFPWFISIVILTRTTLLQNFVDISWYPRAYPSIWTSTQSDFTHGTMFWYNGLKEVTHGRMANEEGLIANGTSIHAGLRTRLFGKTFSDYDHDEKVGFVYIETDGISHTCPTDMRYR